MLPARRDRFGDYEPGQVLPSEVELADEYNLSWPTINKAIRQLVSENLVTVEDAFF